jgi:hypothetical protein
VVKGQDIVVLVKLCIRPSAWTVRGLTAELGLPHAAVQRSLQRLSAAGLYDSRRRRVNVSRAEEFLVHAVKYLFPGQFGGEVRGVPTAWAAEPLRQQLAPQSDLPPVWPEPMGRERGLALEPVHESVPEIARRDRELGEALALVDAIRTGDARVSALGAELLSDRLVAAPIPA